LGGARRFTGSRALPPGGVPPATTFYGEPMPTIDLASWRLKVHGRVRRPMTLTTAELARHATQTREATLDCTSGWAMTTSWSGVPTASLLAAAEPLPGARWVIVTAATGWSTRISLEEAGATLLATRVGGETLPPANGAPCRLVAPQRRGLDWVKWVTEIQVV
jgi:DMSO/TMAO reductase YedYZ molybdopterin-dependent catalytic subunit